MNAVDKIEEFAKFGSRLGLERISALMELLGNPQDQLKYIHVAGTNGKGSVCRYLYEALKCNGYKVGVYTSPFLEVFNERIEFDGKYITDEELSEITKEVLEKVDEIVKAGHESPTEFEVITSIAFVYFERKKADFVILEVGLGGRGDSTNIIKDPLATVITSISFDHMDRLGETLSEISAEKAGIIKPGTRVIMNVKEREAAVPIARKAYENSCVLYDATKIPYGIINESLDGTIFDANIYGTDYSGVELGMVGEHQVKNAITALTTLEILRKDGHIIIERTRLYEGMKRAKNIGRFEVMAKSPYIILDGAHNEEGVSALKKTLLYNLEGQKILIVWGMLKDKAVSEVTDIIADIKADFAVTEPHSDRKLDMNELFDLLKSKGVNCVFKGTPKDVTAFVKDVKNEYDVILFAGSLYLIGEIRGIIRNEIVKNCG